MLCRFTAPVHEELFYLSHFRRNSLDAQKKQRKRTASEIFLTFTKKCADIRILLRSTYIG